MWRWVVFVILDNFLPVSFGDLIRVEASRRIPDRQMGEALVSLCESIG